MYTNHVFHNPTSLTGDAGLMAQATSEGQPATVQPAAEETAIQPIPTELLMVSCLAPFVLVFLVFSTRFTYRKVRFNRWVNRLQKITTLERVLEKTPDECS